ncbi:MAG: hypothetical protein R2847_03045 [Bacteroidia bacterium]
MILSFGSNYHFWLALPWLSVSVTFSDFVKSLHFMIIKSLAGLGYTIISELFSLISCVDNTILSAEYCPEVIHKISSIPSCMPEVSIIANEKHTVSTTPL